MRFYLIVLVLISCMLFNLDIIAQETAPAPVRTPEQEATLQTLKMQKELNLNNDQLQTIYEINLKHARERQASNSRSQALERTKNKNSEIRQVLTTDQYNRLQDKRYERYPAGANSYTNPSVPQQRTTQPIAQPRTSGTNVQQQDRNTQVRTQPSSRQTNPNSRAITPSTNRSTIVAPPTRDNGTPVQNQERNSRSTPPSTSSGNSERTQRR
jgi:hypothetical protein